MRKPDDNLRREVAQMRAEIKILTTLICDLDMAVFEQQEQKKNGPRGLTPREGLIIEHIAN